MYSIAAFSEHSFGAVFLCFLSSGFLGRSGRFLVLVFAVLLFIYLFKYCSSRNWSSTVNMYKPNITYLTLTAGA